MNMRSPAANIRTQIVAAAFITAGTLLTSVLPVNAAWQHAHGDSDWLDGCVSFWGGPANVPFSLLALREVVWVNFDVFTRVAAYQ